LLSRTYPATQTLEFAKVFCFFSSEKKTFLSCLTPVLGYRSSCYATLPFLKCGFFFAKSEVLIRGANMRGIFRKIVVAGAFGMVALGAPMAAHAAWGGGWHGGGGGFGGGWRGGAVGWRGGYGFRGYGYGWRGGWGGYGWRAGWGWPAVGIGYGGYYGGYAPAYGVTYAPPAYGYAAAPYPARPAVYAPAPVHHVHHVVHHTNCACTCGNR
jgi:hypothetical protein